MTRTPTIRRCVLSGVAVLSLGLAACGGDDDEGGDDTAAPSPTTAEDEAAVDTAADDTTADDTGAEVDTTEPTSGEGGDVDIEAYVAAATAELDFADAGAGECVARALIENLDPADIAAADVTPEEFVAAESIAEIGIEVDDELRATMEADAANCDGLAAALIEDQFSGDEATKACVTGVLTDAIVANVFVTQLTAGEPSDEALAAQAATQECTAEG